jgi:prevent-host-death family protein
MENISVTEAKARFSGVINRLIYKKSMIAITNHGKHVAVILPWETFLRMRKRGKGGLLEAAGVLADYDQEIEEMVKEIYEHRRRSKGRPVNL